MIKTVLLACGWAWFLSAATTPTAIQQAEILAATRSSTAQPLLFPFIFAGNGFETEITISNTSLDTQGSSPQSGSCVLNFYGTSAPAPQLSATIPAGRQLSWNVSQGGGGIAAAPNFLGYMIASCNFPLARGIQKIFGPPAQANLVYSQDAQVLSFPRNTTTPQRLLFPFVTNLSGFDTGIALANTSADPFGSTPTSGTCTLSFFGGNAPPVVTPVIAPGTVYTALTSILAPGFQGYVTASCNFPVSGSAFVADVGARNVIFAEPPEVLTLPRSTVNQSLLFSTVTNANGNDTGITIANTTTDPFGTTSKAGACTLNFYGSNAPSPITTPTINPGSVYTNLVSITAPGFQGYVIASCSFPLARGWSFVSPLGIRTDGDAITAEVLALPRSSTPASLLFSGAANVNGTDTSFVISNTSQDPFGTTPSAGTCKISYFGDMLSGAAPPSPQTSTSIAAGAQLSFSLSQGNPAQGIAGAPGFRGYVIADCGFPAARGTASMTGSPAGYIAPGGTPQTTGPAGVSPTSGNASSTSMQFTFTDTRGSEDLDVVNILINNFLDGRNSCYLAYSRSAGTLYLVADDGGTLQALPALGASGSVSNGQCSVAGTGSSVSTAGNNLVLTLNLTFSQSFAGNKIVYMAARDLQGGNSGWHALGVWTVPGFATFPSVDSLTPARGSGLVQTLTATFSDTKGAQDLGVLNILINDSLDGRKACYIAYSQQTKQLYLVGDAGGGLSPGLILGGTASVSNSQCTISGAGSTANTSGNTVTLVLKISFSAEFVGDRVIYLAARDSTDANNSGWQSLGTTNVH